MYFTGEVVESLLAGPCVPNDQDSSTTANEVTMASSNVFMEQTLHERPQETMEFEALNSQPHVLHTAALIEEPAMTTMMAPNMTTMTSRITTTRINQVVLITFKS